MSVAFREGSVEKGIMSLGIDSVDRVEVLWLVTGLWDGQGLLNPVSGGICGVEPGESKDNIFLAIAHDIEEMFLSDSFDVCVEGAGVANCTSFISSLVHVADHDGGGEFLSRELVFSDKLSVNARYICAWVYQHRGIDDFEGVRGGDQL